MNQPMIVTAFLCVSCSLVPSLPAVSGGRVQESSSEGKQLFKHRRASQCLAFSPDGKALLSGGQDGEILAYDVNEGGDPRKLEGHKGSVTALAFDAAGTLHSGEMYKLVKAWSVADGKEQASASEHRSRITAMAYLPGANLVASIGIGKSLILWKPGTLEKVAELPGHKYQGTGVVSLANGTWIASCDDGGNILFWDVAAKAEKSRFTPKSRLRFACMAASPDGKMLALGDDREKKIYLFDVDKNEIVKTLEGDRARSLAFSPDGRTLAAGTHHNLVQLIDVQEGKVRATFKDHQRAVLAVAFSPDGKKLASGAMDGHVRLWEVPGRP